MTTLSIESLAYGGDAIAHLEDGRTVFVSGAVSGRRRRGRDHRGEATGSCVRARSRCSRRRRIAWLRPARTSALCGGCSWQHVSYAAQLRAKRRAVVDALTRIGHVADAETLVAETVASPAEYGYRNKIELVVDPASSRPRLGFHRAASDEIVAVDECLLLPKALRKAPKALGGALRYVAGEQDLGLTRVAVRVGTHTKDVEIALWGSSRALPAQGRRHDPRLGAQEHESRAGHDEGAGQGTPHRRRRGALRQGLLERASCAVRR